MLFIKHTEDYRGKTVPRALMKAMGEFVGPHRIHAPGMEIECALRPLQAGAPGSEQV
ncbi:MAG TPA: hypothetical protein VLW85_00805 [Myxococcales bacterium]|nr:hypothetical protein [Myxococcales bacterium]